MGLVLFLALFDHFRQGLFGDEQIATESRRAQVSPADCIAQLRDFQADQRGGFFQGIQAGQGHGPVILPLRGW